MRCRPGIVTVRGGPGSAVHRFADARAAPRPGHAIASDPFGALFTFQTAHLVPAAHVCARGLQLCFANPNRGVGGAPRDVRVLSGTPVGRIMCVKDARERAYDAIRQALARRLASHDAGRSPLGAPPWLPSPLIPAQAGIQELGPRFRGDERKEAYATPRSAFRIVSRTRPQ